MYEEKETNARQQYGVESYAKEGLFNQAPVAQLDKLAA
jgi:hypothetical protein